MQSILNIIKLNEVRSGIGRQSGKPYEMQDAECILLNDDGSVGEVGVLQIPRDLMGKVQLGVFMGTFALRADKSQNGGRRIQSVLTGLQPYVVKQAPKAA